MSQRTVSAYPWGALETVTRKSARGGAEARRQVQAVLDPSGLGRALTELIEGEAELVVRRVSSEPPRRRPLAELGFELGDSGVVCALSVEPELAVSVIGRVLRRPVALSAHATLDESLTGAFGAVVLELARRAGALGTLHLLDYADAQATANDVFVDATAVIAGRPYQVLAALGLRELSPSRPAAEAPLRELGELPVAVPLVIGLGLAERTMLADFVVGNAWFPGSGLWLDLHGEGSIALAAATREEGVSGRLTRDGKIVVGGEHVALPCETSSALHDSGKQEPMSDSEKLDPSRVAEAVLDSPVVVRVEMGAVSMTAREWAGLAAGDVIETGRRIAEPVVLRVAGREVARGELVNLEGELGVRIRELVRS